MADFPRMPLMRLLRRVKDDVEIEDDVTYRQVTIRLWNKGVVLRGEQQGLEIKTKRQYRVRSDQLVLSRIDVRNGAIGLLPPELDGAIVSNDFWAYDIDRTLVEPDFLALYVTTPTFIEDSDRTSSGTTKRIRAEEEAFLRIEIPLPPLAEQQRIVARIEELARRVEEARGLRREAVEELDRLLVSMAHRQELGEASKLQMGWKRVALGEVLRQVKDRVSVNPARSYPNLGIYSFGRGLFKKPDIEGYATSAKELYRVRKRQFIYSRLFAFEGACGYITPEYDEHFVSGEYPIFDCDPQWVKPEFLYAYFKLLGVWKTLAAGSKGLGDRRQRVQSDRFLLHILILPPLAVQNEIAEVMSRMNHVQRLQLETQKELDALMPSALAKAFGGEL